MGEVNLPPPPPGGTGAAAPGAATGALRAAGVTAAACRVQGEDKVFRRAPSWRKRFRPREPHGGLLGASAETLPAAFRVASLGPLQPPPAPPKKVTPEGE